MPMLRWPNAADHNIARSSGTGRRDFAILHRSLEGSFDVGRQIVPTATTVARCDAPPKAAQRIDFLGILARSGDRANGPTIDLYFNSERSDLNMKASPAP